jgi:hypothetical protein
MLISAETAAIIGGVVLFLIFQLSPANVVTGAIGFLLTVLARAATALVVPVIAKVFMWYGVAHSKQ